MTVFEIEKAKVIEYTSMEVAIRVCDRNEFLAAKRNICKGGDFDEKKQLKIWQDYKDLFFKAVTKTFEKGDIEKLDSYRRIRGDAESISRWTPGRLIFPTTIERNVGGRIVQIDTSFFDAEVTGRWFEHIYDVLVGRVDVRVCQAPRCGKLFVRYRRKDKKYCSSTCQKRAWYHEHRKKSR